jgi:peptidoglycan/LPS O-acetylase OafA/YrhL
MAFSTTVTEEEMKPASLQPGESERIALGHLPALDGVRGLAILLVLVFHWTQAIGSASKLFNVLAKVSSIGWIGVDLFFVLSGYLITTILLKTRDGAEYYAPFFFRRSLRILPLYVGFLACVQFVVWPLLQRYSPETVSNATGMATMGWVWLFMGNVLMAMHGGNAVPMFTNVFWSLAVEEQFYLIWPIVVRNVRAITLEKVALALLFVAPLLRLLLTTLQIGHPVASYTLMPTRVDALAAGALLSVWSLTPEGQDRIGRYSLSMIALGIAALSVLLWARGSSYVDPVMRTIGYSGVMFVMAGIVGVALLARKRDFIYKVFTVPLLLWLGRYSYGLYVLHVPIFAVLRRVLMRYLGNDAVGLAAQALISAVAVACAAVLVWHTYEKQWLKLKGRVPYVSREP